MTAVVYTSWPHVTLSQLIWFTTGSAYLKLIAILCWTFYVLIGIASCVRVYAFLVDLKGYATETFVYESYILEDQHMLTSLNSSGFSDCALVAHSWAMRFDHWLPERCKLWPIGLSMASILLPGILAVGELYIFCFLYRAVSVPHGVMATTTVKLVFSAPPSSHPSCDKRDHKNPSPPLWYTFNSHL